MSYEQQQQIERLTELLSLWVANECTIEGDEPVDVAQLTDDSICFLQYIADLELTDD